MEWFLPLPSLIPVGVTWVAVAAAVPGRPIGVAVKAAVAMLPAVVVSLVGATGPPVVSVEAAIAGSRCRSREETPAGLHLCVRA